MSLAPASLDKDRRHTETMPMPSRSRRLLWLPVTGADLGCALNISLTNQLSVGHHSSSVNPSCRNHLLEKLNSMQLVVFCMHILELSNLIRVFISKSVPSSSLRRSPHRKVVHTIVLCRSPSSSSSTRSDCLSSSVSYISPCRLFTIGRNTSDSVRSSIRYRSSLLAMIETTDIQHICESSTGTNNQPLRRIHDTGFPQALLMCLVCRFLQVQRRPVSTRHRTLIRKKQPLF